MFTDTHCHLYSEYYDDIDEVVKKAQERQINRVFNNGVDDRTNREILAMLPKYDCMYAAIGIHPEYVKDYKEDDAGIRTRRACRNRIEIRLFGQVPKNNSLPLLLPEGLG